MPHPPPRCSDAARLRGDPMAGTAAPARGWLLVEHHGPWPVDAFGGSGIHEQVQQHLRAAAAAAGARILLIRRPGRQDRRAPRAWAVVHGPGAARPRAQVWGRWRHEEDLLGALPALAEVRQTRSSAALRDQGSGDGEQPPLLLVCAHGRHDVCCAVRGRPVAAALQRRWPEQTWECSHVGGCRFAGNVVVLPDGVYYGGLDGDAAADVLAGHLAGRAAAAHLRGVSDESPAAQAAIAELLQRHGPAAVSAFTSRAVEQVAPTAWRVRVDGPGGLVDVELAQVAAPAAHLTCRAPRNASPREFVVTSVRAAG